MKADRLLETALYVDDLERARVFYCDVLGLVLHSHADQRHVFLRSGDSMFLLFNAERTSVADSTGLPLHGARGPGHAAWLVTDKELEAWRERLQDAGVKIEKDHTWPSGGRSLYFRDPAGNSLEFATASVWGETTFPRLSPTVAAGPWLRVEAAVVLGASLWAYHELGASWWIFAALLLVPDLSMLGYLAGPVVGAWAYNLAHTYGLSLALAVVSWGWGWHQGLLAGLIWTAHVALDRTLGYGLKTRKGFAYTHLGTIGATRKSEAGG